jgi:hypothetical protein
MTRTFGKRIKLALFALFIAGVPMTGRGAPEGTPDPWKPVRFFVGEWEGTAEGQAGSGTVKRSYTFVLHDRYLHEKNVSTYPPQEKNKAGEVHEHWSFFSYDSKRALLVLRQFHQEGFVNSYVMNKEAAKPATLVFDSEGFENFSNSWRAKETYDILSNDEFVETFELAAPGASFETYSRNHFKRVAKK